MGQAGRNLLFRIDDPRELVKLSLAGGLPDGKTGTIRSSLGSLTWFARELDLNVPALNTHAILVDADFRVVEPSSVGD